MLFIIDSRLEILMTKRGPNLLYCFVIKNDMNHNEDHYDCGRGYGSIASYNGLNSMDINSSASYKH